jgi:hypothetical protein
MSATTTQGSDIQRMIDCRLDTLDRLLIGSGVSRAERVDVVQSVEDQIHELVDRKSNGEPTREVVVEVLGELDPPEAYVQDWYGVSTSDTGIRPTRAPELAATPRYSGLAITSFVLSMISLLLLIFFPLGCLVGLAAAVCATVFLIRRTPQKHGVWMAVVAHGIFVLHAMSGFMIAFLAE